MYRGFHSTGNLNSYGGRNKYSVGLGKIRNTVGSINRSYNYCAITSQNPLWCLFQFQSYSPITVPPITVSPITVPPITVPPITEIIVPDIIIRTTADLESYRYSNIINNNLIIQSLEQIDFSALDDLTQINGGIYFINNSNIESITGFNSLQTVNAIIIDNNPNLITINGFNSLHTVNIVTIQNNPDLETIEGFNSLSTIQDLLFN